MATLTYTLLAAGLLITEQLYVYVARRYHLFEAQTERSSHTEKAAVRGGGILFFVATLIAVCVDKYNQLYFLLGLTTVALVSFFDDLFHIPKRYRLIAQVLGVMLLIQQTGILSNTQWGIPGILLLGIGTLNVCNFMDGINGMTAFYGLTTIGSLLIWQLGTDPSRLPILLVSVGMALIIFSFYNARKQAVCFAGDVGSITLGFIILYALLQLVNQLHSYLPLLLLAVYSVDTILTLLYRLTNRQNIFQAHRLHLFQLLVHQKKHAHLTVAGAYASVQAIINSLVFMAIDWSPLAQTSLAVLILAGLIIGYTLIKRPLMREKRSALEADPVHIN